MSNYKTGETQDLYNYDTGKYVGTKNLDGSESLVPTLAIDPLTGKVIGLTSSAGVVQLRNANTLAIIGDSICAQGRADANSVFDATIGANIQTGASATADRLQKFIYWAMALSGQRLTVVSDQSRGGSGLLADISGTCISTTQFQAALASGAGHLLVEGGINDIYNNSVALNAPAVAAVVEQMKTAWLSVVNQAVGANVTVWWVIPHTVGSAYGNYNAFYQSGMLALNDWIRQQCTTVYAKKGVYCVDTAAVIVDPTSTTASARSSYLVSDNLHPSNVAGYAVGKELARLWNLFVPEGKQLLSSNADNTSIFSSSTNVLPNGLFINGAAPGTGFTSSVTGSAVRTSETLIARADGVGFDLVEVMTFTANAETVKVTSATFHTQISNGDIVYAECEVAASAIANLKTIRLQLLVTGATTTFAADCFQNDATNDVALPAGFTARLRTPPIKIDTAQLGALSAANANVTMYAAGAGVGTTVAIGRWSVRKVTATA